MAESLIEKVNLNRVSQDESLDLSQVMHITLLALGFNSEKPEQNERIQISEQIFRRMNQKIGDHILHYLFSCINSKYASKVFRDCWPIYDKKMEAQFRSLAFEWFKSLSQSEEYNLKPSLVVSKAVVMPTSNKFLSSVATLCRIALHSKILQKDPSVNLLYFPSLATKKEQRQKAVHLIKKSNLYHCSQYVTSLPDRTRALESLQSKAKELVDKYRAAVKEKEQIKEILNERLKNSTFLSSAQKNSLCVADFHDFEQEIKKSLAMKNKEMKTLWSKTAGLKSEDEKSWPKIESLIEGKKGFSMISGGDFPALFQIDGRKDFPFIEENRDENMMCYKEGKLDLVCLVETCNLALTYLRGRSSQRNNQEKVEGESREAKDQLRCVTALEEDTKEVKLMLSSILPNLLQSVSNLRREIYSQSDNDESSANLDSFDLCPPTPAFNFENNNSSVSRLRTPYQLVKLTPSRNTSGNIGENESVRHVTVASDRVRNVSRASLLQSLRDKRTTKHKECGSPVLRNSLSQLPNTSSNHTTVDSGCVLSYGADSLLHSIEKLDLTPRSKRNRNSSFGLCKSVLSNSNRKTSILTKKSKDPIRPYDTFGSSIIGSPLVSDFKVENQNNSLNVSFKIDNKENRRKSIIIETGNSFIRNKYGEVTQMSENHRNSDVSKMFLNLTLTNEDSSEDSFEEEYREIKTKALNLADSPKVQIQRSPLISILLNEFNEDDSKTFSSKGKFQRRENASKAKEIFSRKDAVKVQHKPTSKHLSTFREKIMKQNISDKDLSKPSDILSRISPKKVIETVSNDAIIDAEKNYSSQITTSDVEKTFYSIMTSLESRLEGFEETNSKYEFETDSAFSKDLIDASTGFSCDKEMTASYENEQFVDSRTYLEQSSNTGKWLPKQSAFDTLTEAFVSGELASDLFFANDDVEKEIRRESLSSPVRNSLSKKSRRSSGISRRLSTYLRRRTSIDNENIFDVSDSCLLSTSSDVI